MCVCIYIKRSQIVLGMPTTVAATFPGSAVIVKTRSLSVSQGGLKLAMLLLSEC